MADRGSPVRLRPAAELFFLNRLAAVPRVAAVITIAIVAGVAGSAGLAIQAHFAAETGGGRLTMFLAHGSTAATAWAGWAAAFFFLVALLRLRRGPPEPPAGRAPVESLNAAQMRAGLLREYTVVRVALVVLSVIVLVDTGRSARYVVAALSGDRLARGSLAATLIEAAGLCVAAVVLAVWALTFRCQLVRVGALAEDG